MAPASGPRLFLVDGYALIYRAFFALGSTPLVSSRGENTSIALGAHDFLKRLIQKHGPEYLGWVHDAGLSFRHERYPAYKATRERLEPALQADFDTGKERITQILDAYHVPVLSLDGYEADDVIGTLARQAAGLGVNAVIVSGDKDFTQLVKDGISILNPWHGRPGFTREKWYDTQTAHERLGVPPDRVVDYLALLGDTSDNVPGVKGIGEKTALMLLEKYGSLEQILARVDEVEPMRARTALLQFGHNGMLSQELITIREDLPMTLDLPALAVKKPDWDRLRDLFVELEFRIDAQQAAAQAEDGHATTNATEGEAAALPSTGAVLPRHYRVVDTAAAVDEVVAHARAVGYMAIDVATVLDTGAPLLATPLRAKLVGLSIALAPGEAYYLPFAHREHVPAQTDLALASEPGVPKKAKEPASIAARILAGGTPQVKNLPPIQSEEMAPLRALLADPAVKKTAHNAKYDLLVMRRAGIAVQGIDFDSMLASYILDPGRRSHAVDALAIEFLQLPMTPYDLLAGKGKQQLGLDEVPVSAVCDYCCASADVALRLRELLAQRVADTHASALLRDLELPLVTVLADMEWEGIAIDVPWFHSLKSRFTRERAAVEQKIYAAAGGEFNINSNKQLGTVLFEKLALPIGKKTSTGPSTDASVLQELADEGHVLPGLLLEYRELSKLENTYLDILPTLVDPVTGRLHTTFNQTVAATGRLASSDPNLQNIPIRRELGKEIRKGFIPRKGWTMLAADYSQIELRLLAHLSHDPAFLEAFRAGGDIHRQTAAVIFGVPADMVTGEMRARAKTINFATIYGQGAHALSRQLKIEHAEAKAFIDTYFERFAGVRNYLDLTVAQAREQGYVETIFKRRRYIPELKDRNFNIRAFGERTAQNSPIQGSAADLIKVAMIHIHHALANQGLEARMLLQVHDELVFEVPPEEVEATRSLVVREMTTAVTLDVPLSVDVGTGANWLETKL